MTAQATDRRRRCDGWHTAELLIDGASFAAPVHGHVHWRRHTLRSRFDLEQARRARSKRAVPFGRRAQRPVVDCAANSSVPSNVGNPRWSSIMWPVVELRSPAPTAAVQRDVRVARLADGQTTECSGGKLRAFNGTNTNMTAQSHDRRRRCTGARPSSDRRARRLRRCRTRPLRPHP
jgi:hypothetical protein